MDSFLKTWVSEADSMFLPTPVFAECFAEGGTGSQRWRINPNQGEGKSSKQIPAGLPGELVFAFY